MLNFLFCNFICRIFISFLGVILTTHLFSHGITKAAFDTLPPLPEKYYEPGPLNTGLREENSDLFEPHTFSTERSSSTLGHFSQSWSDIEENFTERSSVFSWRHDDVCLISLAAVLSIIL